MRPHKIFGPQSILSHIIGDKEIRLCCSLCAKNFRFANPNTYCSELEPFIEEYLNSAKRFTPIVPTPTSQLKELY
jgi:hypothetical protein